jgi:hypothetical protein
MHTRGRAGSERLQSERADRLRLFAGLPYPNYPLAPKAAQKVQGKIRQTRVLNDILGPLQPYELAKSLLCNAAYFVQELLSSCPKSRLREDAIASSSSGTAAVFETNLSMLRIS